MSARGENARTPNARGSFLKFYKTLRLINNILIINTYRPRPIYEAVAANLATGIILN